MVKDIEISFLGEAKTRYTARLIALFICFMVFQILILLQKPFLQFQFTQIFYLSFSILFGHHLVQTVILSEQSEYKYSFMSYFVDFLVLVFFMRQFSYLSSFVLVMQLFLLFIASFDLSFIRHASLGFILSIGTSLINFSTYQAGSAQSILGLVLFNLSYLSIIIVSRQLKTDFTNLQSDLTLTQKKWRSQERFAKILIEKMPLGIAVLDKNRDILTQNFYFNDELQLQGREVKELINKCDEKNSLYEKDIIQNSRVFNFDKTSYFDEEISEKLDIFLIKDVTEIRQLEAQLHQNEKLAAVGTLAAGIAHEIRNPLAGISGSIQMLSQDVGDPTQKKLMDIVLREINRLNSLITEFLDYAKPEKKPTDIVNLKNIIDEVLTSLASHPDVPKNFKWSVNLRDVSVLGYVEKLKQALLNMLINSLQALQRSQEPSISVSLNIDGECAVLSIKDNGCGMSDETKKKLFEPFHTTKTKGTGLGLAITHKILDTHGATVTVLSEINQGTEFIIKLPLAKSGERL